MDSLDIKDISSCNTDLLKSSKIFDLPKEKTDLNIKSFEMPEN
jgi:hypothetical protein